MSRTTEQQLEAARKRLAQAEAAWDRTGPATRDPGALSGIKGYNDTQARVTHNIRKASNAAREAIDAQREVEALEAKLSAQERNQRIRDTAVTETPIEDLHPGDIIRYEKYGSPRNLGRVIRNNQKTITIDAPPGYDKPKINKNHIIATHRPQEQK
ncbi:hypothetical protein ACFP47_09345 [Nesterenkonia lacusekhoensis]|uniref:Uncharacterized protein n=1 Tax=Nesterenkonia lacusekhoensis TaxID=150832 RepID=A0ABS4SYW0_9MICC|nr:hypothetical protein [Nesterenkonia lacusekhoensis]MBP2317380.1 hypothetical protein [Nesterenkonia lacusekhoensis]